MIICGIDPGIADTGWGIISETPGNKLKCLGYGSVKTPAGMPLGDRLIKLAADLEKILQEFKPELIGIEELFFCTNVKTAITVGQARGVALLCARRSGAPVFEFTPLQVKQAVAAYGGADKKQVQRMVALILNLCEIPKPDDAADALAIAIATGQNSKMLKISG